jgi:hypothetical protein
MQQQQQQGGQSVTRDEDVVVVTHTAATQGIGHSSCMRQQAATQLCKLATLPYTIKAASSGQWSSNCSGSCSTVMTWLHGSLQSHQL